MNAANTWARVAAVAVLFALFLTGLLGLVALFANECRAADGLQPAVGLTCNRGPARVLLLGPQPLVDSKTGAVIAGWWVKQTYGPWWTETEWLAAERDLSGCRP